MSGSNPNTDKYNAEASGFLSFLRRDNRFARNNIFVSRQKKTDTENISFWETISANFYNGLKAFGIIDPSSMKAKFDFEFISSPLRKTSNSEFFSVDFPTLHIT